MCYQQKIKCYFFAICIILFMYVLRTCALIGDGILGTLCGHIRTEFVSHHRQEISRVRRLARTASSGT